MRPALIDLAADAVTKARRAGAEAAEAFAVQAREFEVTVRGEVVDRVDSALAGGIGVRVFARGRQGLSYTTGHAAGDLDRLVAEAMAVASAAEPEPEAALPEAALTSVVADDRLDLMDPEVERLDPARRIAMAREAEDAALACEGVSGSEGSTFGDMVRRIALVSSLGLSYEHVATLCSLVSRPVATPEPGREGGQARSWFSSARHLTDLEEPQRVGERAGRRAAGMSGARPVPPGRAAVIFDPMEAGRFWAGLFGAFSGDAARKGLSWIADSLGESIGSSAVTLIDDGRIRRGIGSAPRDGEGVPRRRNVLVESGRLRSFLYDCRTARKVGAQSTGSASRSYRSLPGVGSSNFYLEPGPHAPEKLIADTRRGLYVTHTMGFGVNLTTGDFSRGASGMWIENGEFAFPVQEVVISGSLPRMLGAITRVASDHVMRSAVSSPTFRIDEMTISGRSDDTRPALKPTTTPTFATSIPTGSCAA